MLPNAADIGEDALKGWARFCGSMGTTANGTKYTDDLIKVFGGAGNFDKAGFEAVMKQLSEVGNDGFKLTLEAGSTTRWQSPSGIIYDIAPSSSQGHRISHALSHTVPIPEKPSHGVWTFTRDHLFQKLDEIWSARTTAIANNFGDANRVNDVIKIPWSGAGTEAGQDFIAFITKRGTQEIVTAFPVGADWSPL